MIVIEALKVNTTITELNLWSDEEEKTRKKKREMKSEWQTMGLEMKEQNQ